MIKYVSTYSYLEHHGHHSIVAYRMGVVAVSGGFRCWYRECYMHKTADRLERGS